MEKTNELKATGGGQHVDAGGGLPNFDEIVTPIPERISSKLKIPYYVFWSISGVLFGGAYASLYSYLENSNKYVWPHFSLATLPFFLILSVIFFSKLLENFTPSLIRIMRWDKEKTISWYSAELRSVFNEKNMFLFSTVFALFLIYCSFCSPLYPNSNIFRTIYITTMAFMEFIAGGAVYVLCSMLYFVYKIGKTNAFNVSIHQHPVTSIKAVGVLMCKIAWVILSIYIYGISFMLFIEIDKLIGIIVIFFGLFIIAFFIFPQIHIHNIMVKVKRDKLIAFSDYLESSLKDVTDDPSQKNIQRVRELFSIQTSLNSMSDWPFNTRLFFTLITSIAIPIIAVLLQIWGDKIQNLF